jgi:hypothetical protein
MTFSNQSALTAATQGRSAALDFTTRLALADGFRQRRSLVVRQKGAR